MQKKPKLENTPNLVSRFSPFSLQESSRYIIKSNLDETWCFPEDITFSTFMIQTIIG